ncbi:MAG: hypothetical protein HS117_11730 [Verrucomicrobiaceae bacterium]|nr:hypothetical protein [Verrucomicrobiaceae bacterium]
MSNFEGSTTHWHFLDIQPVLYPRVEGENRHQALADGLEKWALRCRQSFLDNVRRLTQYAKSGPPWGDPEEQDFVEVCFSDSELLPHFVNVCRNVEWLDWIQQRGLLRNLFNPEATLSNCDGLIAWWMTRHLLADNTPRLLRLIQELGPDRLNPAFCHQIHSTLAFLKHEKGVSDVFPTWVVVLLAQPSNRLPRQSWARLLAACEVEGALPLACTLFERATELNVVINKHWSFAKESSSQVPPVKFDVKLDHEAAYHLDQAWKLVLQPNLPKLAPHLEQIVTQRIMQANAILRVVDRAGDGYDPLSIGRSSIEPHPQDEFPDDFEYLIDVARDIVASYQTHSPHRAEAIIWSWLERDVTLLRRLAIHALARQPTLTQEQIIHECLERKLLFDQSVRTEVYFLLRQMYASLGAEERELLFQAIEAGPDEDQSRERDDEDKQWMIFKLIGWIAQGDPSCPLAKSKFAAQQSAHPKWGLSEHPDLLMWTSGFGFVAPGAGLDFEATLNKPAQEFLQLIGTAPPSGRFEERRDNLCSALPSLMSKNIDWAVDCQRAACEMGIQDDDVWQYICMGWRDVKPSEGQWSQIVAVINNPAAPAPFFLRLPDTLEAWAKRKEDGVPQSLLAETDDVALMCWQKALREDPVSSEATKDWLSKAINHPGGSYAEYLLLRLDAIRKSCDAKIDGIPEPIRGALVEIIHGGSGSGEMGRVIIAAQVRWLHAIDPGFANAEVMPLFDWCADAKRAEQCWHGFLDWGHWSPPIIEKLLPGFTETVRRLASHEEEDSERMGERVAGHLAALCLWRGSDPAAHDWLLCCIRTMAVENRRSFVVLPSKLDKSQCCSGGLLMGWVA